MKFTDVTLNLNLTFKPEFSCKNLMFLLRDRFSSKEAVKSAGLCFFLDQLFKAGVEEQTVLWATWREKWGEDIYCSNFNSILTSCYHLLWNLLTWNFICQRYFISQICFGPENSWLEYSNCLSLLSTSRCSNAVWSDAVEIRDTYSSSLEISFVLLLQ